MDKNPMETMPIDLAAGFYRLSCAVCGCTSELAMYAIRNQAGKPSRMIGWLFACPLHDNLVAGGDLAKLFGDRSALDGRERS